MSTLPPPPDDELTPDERRALEAWPPTPPPTGFADRVVTARAAAEIAAPLAARARRRKLAGRSGAVAAVAAAGLVAYAALGSHAHGDASHGTLAHAAERQTLALGLRAVAVAEPGADVQWDLAPDGVGEIQQRAGDVFYRVERGGPLVVHTPAGDVRVLGTCFRIEVQMNKPTQMIASGVAGAALATAVVVTVYEGRVVAQTRGGGTTEVAAGGSATLTPGGALAASAGVPSATADVQLSAHSHDQLVAELAAAQARLAQLREQMRQLGAGSGTGPDTPAVFVQGEGIPYVPTAAPDGRPWHAPSAATLADFAAHCIVRFDAPDPRPAEAGALGLTSAEVPAYNRAVQRVTSQLDTLVKALYVEATGDAAGADTLSIESMEHEINDKAAPGEASVVRQKLAQERAGLVPPPTPAQLAHASPLERLVRAQASLGDDAETAVGKALGSDRAAALRGDAWSRRTDLRGCPE